MASTPSSKSTTKTVKNSKKVVLRLQPHLLAKFAPPPPSPKPDNALETNDTPAPTAEPTTTDDKSLAPPPAASGKRKGVPGPKPGTKRTAAQSESGGPKPRGKPGPKKKPRLADGTIDHSADGSKKGPFTGPTPINTHKLGPKANTGAINAGLRALDRSGKPCRRWERKGFELKSISGIAWTVGSWSTPQKEGSAFSGDVKSESSDSSQVNKATMESSAVPSDRSNSGDVSRQDVAMESSPAPALATEA